MSLEGQLALARLPARAPWARLPEVALGSIQAAQCVAERARDRVAAYRAFLESRGVPEDTPFSALPVTDKASYLIPAAYADLLADDHLESFTIVRSSGASGRSFYWPQLKDDHRWAAQRLRGFLDFTFGIHERRTAAVVALSLGSWAGGEQLSWSLRNVALESPYPFAVFSPGNRHDEVIEFICGAEPLVDQFIVAVCPSQIGHILLLAESMGRSLPLGKLRFLVTGEPFPETLRASICQRAGLTYADPFMLSMYGSADTGTLGVESLASIALRRLLTDHQSLATSLGVGPVVPHLFHCSTTDAYLETIDGELCVTRWQGIPLVRYNLHDRATLIAWAPLREIVLEAVPEGACDPRLRNLLRDAPTMPDILAISGRADASVIIGGTKLTEAMLDEAVRSPALAPWLTGAYRASVIIERDRSILTMDLELRPGIPSDSWDLDETYRELMRAIGRIQPEFASDWENLYRVWDRDPLLRVLRLRGLAWPALSKASEQQVKARRIAQPTPQRLARHG